MQSFLFSMSYDVSSAEVDPNYKHVHHADSLRIIERGRLAWFESLNIGQPFLISQGFFPVITELRVDYLREIRQERLLVTCDDLILTEKNIVIGQSVFNERSKVAIRVSTTLAVIAAGRGVKLPILLREALHPFERPRAHKSCEN